MGPSGVGKTTVANRLCEMDPSLYKSISMTTRPPREGEVNGVDYHFVSERVFKTRHMIEKDLYGDYYYGTPRNPIQHHIGNGTDVIAVLTRSGHINIQRYGLQPVGIFLVPPSVEELKDRVKDRPERIYGAASELNSPILNMVQYIVNEDVEETALHIMGIILNNRLNGRMNEEAREIKSRLAAELTGKY